MLSFAHRMRNRVRLNRRRPAAVVEPSVTAAIPRNCANCCAIAAQSRRETLAGRSLLIPYCSKCWEDIARDGTRQIAACVASALIVITLLLTLPWLLSGATWVGFAALVAVGGATPLLVAWSLARPLRDEQSCSGRAAFWLRPGQLVCFNLDWAAELVGDDAESADAGRVQLRERTLAAWMWAPVALGLLATPSLYTLNFPKLVVLNFGDTPVQLLVDDEAVGHVEPTSLESRSAGTRVRVSAGEHVVVALTPEQVEVERRTLRLDAGGLHLLALGASGYCFWIERDHYGKQTSQPKSHQLLDPRRPFWRLPERVDSWFGPNASPSTDDRSSGGTMVALRHAPCDDVPAAVRPRATQ